MAQHFLRSPAARDLTLQQVLNMREDQAYRWFYRARWPDGTPWCPHCGAKGAYHLTRNGKKVNRFKCVQKGCRREFTVTSNTPFAHHKLSFRKILTVVALFSQGVKGKAALVICREVGVAYKTAWALLMKMREALAAERETVELDGAYVGGKPRPENRAIDRVDGRARENAAPADKQVVTALRQRPLGGEPDRTLAFVTPGESEAYIRDIVRRHVGPNTVLLSDEHPAYQSLKELNRYSTVNHKQHYSAGRGLNTNLVESYFTRLRRSERGIHHRLAGRYLDLYAAGLAWQENNRKLSFRRRTELLLSQAMGQPQSRYFTGYWQGHYPERALGWRLAEP
ncbi:IS1595 family transposase [Roseomonas chloroacetimidivorans]|uniref:IS1595 family transposase n=1 Tax=Roseomonas chloroacetimidivorans TaxID=1766656 RepID=UPI003C756EEE